MKRYLFTPGPVELPDRVLYSAAKPLIGHRCREFSEIFAEIERKLSLLLKSEVPVIILPSSGTGALECLAVNFLSKGDKFISVSCGVFGNRFRKIAKRTGAEAVCMDVTMGEGFDIDKTVSFVKEHPECKVLLLTHNETSTGVVNPIKEIISLLPKENRPIILVDGVSSVGAIECYPQEWGVDGLAFASQKGILCPPGLSFVWLSKKGWNYIANKNCPSYYYDLKLHLKSWLGDSPSNPYTPPVSLYFALDEALNEILEKGLDVWFESHKRFARALASGISALGFKLLVQDEYYRSPGVTSFGGSYDMEKLRENLSSMGVDTAGGQDALKGKIIRIAHYNNYGWTELSLMLGSLYGASENKDTETNFLADAWNIWNLGGNDNER